MRCLFQCVNKNVKTFVIDTEAVAYDIKEKKLLPFQQLTTRKRKDVRTEDITVRVHIFAFDLLYLNGEVRATYMAQVCSFAYVLAPSLSCRNSL